jgi:ketosteroid isomerase-like protein
MSENLDLVRSIYAAWERGDFSSAEWAHPQIEFGSPMGIEGVSTTGVSEMASAWRETVRAWDNLKTKAEEFRELDDERVLVLYSFSGHGRLSGLDVSAWTGGAALFHVRGNKVTRLILYLDRERGLADLGLEE